ncbi:MAG: DUF3120 domain-containing protein [Leptolyngbyaceae cyanobacterium]
MHHPSPSIPIAPHRVAKTLHSSYPWLFIRSRVSEFCETFFWNPRSTWIGALLGVSLVSLPVFLEAPIVRVAPWLGVAMTGLWIWLGNRLSRHLPTAFAGDLLIGLSWSWLAGAIYWGWFRWEPLWHLPIESIGLPVALWGLYRGRRKVGHWFYLGSLLGTAITDLYFYCTDLLPYWRQLMLASPDQALNIIRTAFVHIQTVEGLGIATVCAGWLLVLAWWGWRSSQRHFWVFSGTLIGTLLVDSLFLGLAL